MLRENRNSNVSLLVFARPADSLYTLMVAFSEQQEHPFNFYSNIFEVLAHLSKIPDHQNVLLLLRPAAISSEASRFLQRHYPGLQMIGWLDPHENMSDKAFQKDRRRMIMINHFDQLMRMIDIVSNQAFDKLSEQIVSDSGSECKIDPIGYKLSHHEINALLGVE